MRKYYLTMTSKCGEKKTRVSGDSVQECIDKLEHYHTFGEFESGWYIKICYIKIDYDNNK